MKIAQEEIFGPVMSVLKFKDEEEVRTAYLALHHHMSQLSLGRQARQQHPLRSGCRRVHQGHWPRAYRAFG